MEIVHQQISRSIEDTLKFARYLVRILKPNDIVLLEGDLGSGKTLLVKQICNLLKTKDEAASPSFAIFHQYNGRTPVNHFDFYRLHDEAELDQLGWEEMLNMGAITFIEWSQLIEKHLSKYYKVEIKFQDGDRIFVLKKYP